MGEKTYKVLFAGLLTAIILLGLTSIALYFTRQSLSNYQYELLSTNRPGVYYQPTSVAPDVSFPFIRMNGMVHSFAILRPSMEILSGEIYVEGEKLLLEYWIPVRISTYTSKVEVHKHGERDIDNPDTGLPEQHHRNPGDPVLYKSKETDRDAAPATQLKPECERLGFCRR